MTPRLLPAPAPLRNPKPAPAGVFGPSNPRITDWRGKRVWVVGASSGIGRALAQALDARGARVVVSGRDAAALQAFTAAHPSAHSIALDVVDLQAVRSAGRVILAAGPLDVVVYCAAHYRALRAHEWSLPEMLRHHEVNYVGALHVLDAVLPALQVQGHGHVSLVGSVAGYRGLPRGLGYGPTKAALIHLAETLYLDLRREGLGVSIINPGFVRTPLTAQNDFRMPALMSPEDAAQAIVRGWARGRFEIHFPRRFTWGMKLLKLMPFPLYQAAVRRFTGE
jgi:NAD(P)-dependent dehydrogenase (short-subunit alcohol dehydrogenase family)